MKFTFDRDSLLKEVSISQEIISTKNAISILSNIYLEAINNTLLIRATDIKTKFETSIPVAVEEEGSTTVFCDKFMSIISNLPSGKIEFIQKDLKIQINSLSKNISFQLKSIASDKFPEFNFLNTLKFFDISIKDLKDMIRQTIFSISDDETRYFMNGIFMEKNEGNLIFVATDGRRLAYISKEINIALPEFNGAIIPPKILQIISHRAPDEGLISIALYEKNIYFKFSNYEFSSLLIEGQFPKYTRVIPESQLYNFEFNTTEMLEALKRVSLFVEQKSRRIYLNLKDHILMISSSETEMGTAKEEIECSYNGDEISFAVNCMYIEEPLKVINSEKTSIEFTESMKALTICSVPKKDFFHVIMPMQMD